MWLLICTLVLLVPLYLYFKSSRSRELPTNWPIVYMLPSLLANLHNMYDYLTLALAGSGHNMRAHGPPGTGIRRLFFTCDPANVRYMLTTNHANFPKGREFAATFDIMEGSIFTSDAEEHRQHRAKMQSVMSSPRFVTSVVACCRDTVEEKLLPLFAQMATRGTPFDMQEMVERLMFDLTATMVLGMNPSLLSVGMPAMDIAHALDTVMEVAFYRNMMPTSYWKAMRWLNIGRERRLGQAQTLIKGYIEEAVEERRNATSLCTDVFGGGDFLSSYIDDADLDRDLLRATLISAFLAGRDTVGVALAWHLYNLSQNPDVMATIRNELSPVVSRKVASSGICANDMVIFEPEETKSLVYMTAAIYETLRLYPSAPFAGKTVVADDVLPSGHQVHAGDTICISLHSMGRMQGIWGKDCLDYNPTRWLSEDRKKLRYVPSHKFLAFNSGPRMCLGKDIAFMQMNTIVAAVVWNFDVDVVEGQNIQPKPSTMLQMKNGFMVKLKKASTS